MGKFRAGKSVKKYQDFKKEQKQQQGKIVDKVQEEKERTKKNEEIQRLKALEYEKKQLLQFHKDLDESKNDDDDEKELKKMVAPSKNDEKEIKQVVSKLEKESNMSEATKFLLKEDIEDKRKVIVVLEGCMLETAKVNRQDVLLNSDEHKGYISSKLNRDFSEYRPDVVHHALLSLMDSPLNKAGLMQVYIHTAQNVLIEINPNTKIPRTYKRFAALMVQLLNKLRIRAVQTSETLLKVIKNPITDHLPQDCIKVGTSCEGRLVKMSEFVEKLPQNNPICLVVGGVSKGNPGGEADYVDDVISCSKYSMSAGYCIGRMLAAFENQWDIL